MKISLIHPSRSRPQQAAATAKAWLSSAKDRSNIEYLMGVDSDDPNRYDYEKLIHPNEALYGSGVGFVFGDNKSAIDAINRTAKFATGDLFIVVSDDFACPFHWDAALINMVGKLTDFIVKTEDGAQPWIITLPIMDRVYYERFGYIYPPHILHMFADTWMTHVADLLDKKIDLPITFKHNHYTALKQPPDAINIKNDRTWGQGELAYLEGVRTNFGLRDDEIVGRLRCDRSHINWLKSKGVQIEIV